MEEGYELQKQKRGKKDIRIKESKTIFAKRKPQCAKRWVHIMKDQKRHQMCKIQNEPR